MRLALAGLLITFAFNVPQCFAIANDFYGINTADLVTTDAATRRASLQKMHANGVGVIRQPFDWSQIEPARGQFDFKLTDQLAADAAAAGVRVLPVLFNPPDWASSRPAGSTKHGTYPPANPADMGHFAAVLTARYGRGGNFWRQSGYKGKFAFRSWQIWNEPNLEVFWPSGPNPHQYVQLLKASYQAIKSIDSRAEVVAAGLPPLSRKGVGFKKYVAQFLKAGGAKYFDSFALHAYSSVATTKGLLRSLNTTHTLMTHYGRDKPIWITEIGWATAYREASGSEANASAEADKVRITELGWGLATSETSGNKTNENGQARNVRAALAGVCRYSRALNIRGVIYYSWRDLPPYSDNDWWGLHTGLNYIDGNSKPALTAYKSASKCSLPSAAGDLESD